MFGMVWAQRIAVTLLAVCYGWVLPAHHHAPHTAHPAQHASDLAEHGHHDAGHSDHSQGDEHDHDDGQHAGHSSDCAICHASRTAYASPAAAPQALAPAAAGIAPAAPSEQLVSVRSLPVYHGRAPPASA